MKGILRGFLCVSIVLTTSCRKKPVGEIIARVGDAVLTLEDAKTHIDTSHGPYGDRLRLYAMNWVDEELIYQEAVRRDVEKRKDFRRVLDETRRQLVNRSFLDDYIFSDKSGVTEEAVHRYYQEHSEELFVDEEMMRLNFLTFNSREPASSFASALQRGAAWEEAVSAAGDDSVSAAGMVSKSSGIYYTRQTLYPGELWKVALTLNTGEISYPVKTPLGYTVIQLLSSVKKGTRAEYSIVRDEIVERLVIESRRKRYNKLINDLRKNTGVEIFLEEKN